MTEKPGTQNDRRFWKSPVFWAPIIAALIGLFPFLLGSDNPKTFLYSVRVQQQEDAQPVPNATIILEVAGQAPLDEITDSNGLARLFVEDSHAGKPGRLLITASGYETYRQEIDLTEDNLPETILLKSLP